MEKKPINGTFVLYPHFLTGSTIFLFETPGQTHLLQHICLLGKGSPGLLHLSFLGTKKEAHQPVCIYFLLLVYTLDIAHWSRYRPDLFAIFLPCKKKNLRSASVKPSAATVHRTVAFKSSNLAFSIAKKTHT